MVGSASGRVAGAGRPGASSSASLTSVKLFAECILSGTQ